MFFPTPLLTMAETPLERVAELVLLLAVILVVANLAGEAVRRYASMPPVLGELAAGILIGPFALGGIELGSFGPFFEVQEQSNDLGKTVRSSIAVEPELFFMAQIAAIILLFMAGLETNRQQFFRWIRPAMTVAGGGVILPFFSGFMATVIMGFASFGSIEEILPALFIGSILTATSVGITTRVLADINRLDSPEGTTIIASAVVDDVIGILIVAIVVGIAETGDVSGADIAVIGVKAIGFWVGLLVIGSLVATRISSAFLWFRTPRILVGLTLFLVFLASAVAEIYFGLAMIIGAYTIGLALSDTELKHRIEGPINEVAHFIVPVFFVVIGMQVEIGAIGGAIAFGIVLSALGLVTKLAGAGIPALAVGFNRRGAWRVGTGMMPRGEVALIIAGTGLASGVIGPDLFGVAVLMTVVSALVTPAILSSAFTVGGSGLRRPEGE